MANLDVPRCQYRIPVCYHHLTLPSGKLTVCYGKSQSPIGTSTISKRAMFNSYVKLPEGFFEGREVRVRTSPNLHLPWNIQSCGQPGGFREDSMTLSSLKNWVSAATKKKPCQSSTAVALKIAGDRWRSRSVPGHDWKTCHRFNHATCYSSKVVNTVTVICVLKNLSH